MHPIVPYVAEEWQEAKEAGRAFDPGDIQYEEVAARCLDSAKENPAWNEKLHSDDLTEYVPLVDTVDLWWLPPVKRVEAAEGESKNIIQCSFHP